METERTIKELLILTLVHLKEMDLKDHGLCFVILQLNISDNDYYLLRGYLTANLPKRSYAKQIAYRWKPGNKTPRIKWLTKQINSL